MRKDLILLLTGVLLLSGCAESPDLTVTRHQIDDLADDDSDGVVNQRDICNETPAHTEVDNRGCTKWNIQEKVEVLTIEFDFDRYYIRDDQLTTLDKIYGYLNENDNARVILVGDTSPEGTDAYNQKLAMQRSSVVKQQLINMGIADSRISEQEYYQETAITRQLKARNRRTIAVLFRPVMTTEQKWDIYSSERRNSNSEN